MHGSRRRIPTERSSLGRSIGCHRRPDGSVSGATLLDPHSFLLHVLDSLGDVLCAGLGHVTPPAHEPILLRCDEGKEKDAAQAYREGSPVAFWAHVGGFVFGAGVALFIKLTLVEEAFLAPAIEQKTTLFAQNPKVTSALHLIDSGKYQEAVRPLLGAIRDNPDDVDALDLLAQSYQSMGKEKDAAQAYARKVRSHLKRRERDLSVGAYFDMVECSRDASLPPRDSLALGPALVEDDRRDEAVKLYQRVIDSVSDPSIKLRASLALADLYVANHQGKRALHVLNAAAPMAETLPEWKLHLEEKLEAARKLVPALSEV